MRQCKPWLLQDIRLPFHPLLCNYFLPRTPAEIGQPFLRAFLNSPSPKNRGSLLPSWVERVTMVPLLGIPQLRFSPALPPWASHSSACTGLIQRRYNNMLARAKGMWGEAGPTWPASDSWKKQSRELSPHIFFLLHMLVFCPH